MHGIKTEIILYFIYVLQISSKVFGNQTDIYSTHRLTLGIYDLLNISPFVRCKNTIAIELLPKLSNWMVIYNIKNVNHAIKFYGA